MGNTFRALGATIGVLCASVSGFASAAEFPTRPIRLIVPYAAGGSTDMVARMYGDLLKNELKQPVLIENKPGAGTNIGNKLVADAEPDGYTLLYATGQLTQNVTFGPQPAIDPSVSLEAVSLILTSPQMIAANKDQKFSSPEELIEAAKAKPKSISIASAQLQLYVSALESQAGIQLLHVPYKGGAPAVTDTIGGQTNLIMGQPPVLLPFIRKGVLKPIAILSREPSAALPGVKTFAQVGVANLNLVTWNGVFAPKGTPAAVVNRLAEASKIALADPSLARLANDGLMIQSSTPAQLSERVSRDVLFWKEAAKNNPSLLQGR